MTAMHLPQLRDYQQDAVNELRREYQAGRRRVLFVLPTGGGKTFVFSFVAMSAVQRANGRVLILVHRQELLEQASRSLRAIGVAHGIIAAGYPWQPRQRVQVASVQTLVRRVERIVQAGWSPTLIVVDEAHHAVAGSWETILRAWPGARHLGVTATPIRGNGQGLSSAFDALVEGPQIGELIARGHLSPPVVYAPPTKLVLDGVKTRGGDYDRQELAKRTDKAVVTGDAVEHYGRICPGVPAIVFCVSVAHAEHVAEQFRAKGWRFKSIDGSMEGDRRRGLIRDLAEGRLDGLTSCDLISEGTDIPVVGAAIMLRATKSLGLYLQMVGRALRIYPGKTCAYIIDHVGVCAMHGFPDDPRAWSLDGTKRRTVARDAEEHGPPPPITCPRCFAQIRRDLLAAPPTVCTQCGEDLPKPKDRMDAMNVDTDTQLVQASTAEDRVAMHRARLAEQGQCQDLDSLMALAVRRGYRNPTKWAMQILGARAAKRQVVVEAPPTPADEGPPLW